MLTSSASRTGRRGIVLVLVLAMLGLLALIGITFATYAGQSKINNRNFMLSLFQPQADELIDFGMAQLITDTNDIRSVIRGHSLARDMYGNDAAGNALLSFSPTSGLQFSITAAATGPNPNQYILTTNIASNDHSFFAYNFTRWIMRVTYNGSYNQGSGGSGAISQSFEILVDSNYSATSTNARTFTVFMSNPYNSTSPVPPLDGGGSLVQQLGLIDPMAPANLGTALYNPTQGLTTQLPGLYIWTAATQNQALGPNTFTLDGRWQHAFNGAGVGGWTATTGLPASYYGNYRYTGVNVNQPSLGVPSLNSITSPGLDEDYDACDLENWFLAVQSADGQVVIPSFHRPAIIRVDPNNNTNDWLRQNQTNNGAQLWADSAARILRPCQADGHDAATFPDLYPDRTTGQIPYDVDNDGDGKPDSVWLDLGYPARRDASGRLYKPLYAFMVIGLNGRIPLNTAGNLAAQVAGIHIPSNANSTSPATTPPTTAPSPSPPTYLGGPGNASHLGNSISEVDPTYALQNGFNSFVPSGDPLAAFAPPQFGVTYPLGGAGPATFPSDSQVDNAGIDVRLTQLRNLLAGTRPPVALGSVGAVNGDNNFVLSAGGHIPMPNGIAEPPVAVLATTLDTTLSNGTDANGFPLYFLVRSTPPVPGRWGEAQSIPGTPFGNPLQTTPPTLPLNVNVVVNNYTNPVRAGYSFNIKDIISGFPPDAGDDNFNSYDAFPNRFVTEGANTIYGGEVGDLDFYDSAGALVFPVERMRRWVTPADINGTGQVDTWNPSSRGVNNGPDAMGRVEFNSYFRPPGSPGSINTTTAYTVPPPVGEAPNGTIAFGSWTAGAATLWTAGETYLPDVTNNPLHGFESFRFPNQQYYNANATPPGFSFLPQQIGGSPFDQNFDTGNLTATPPVNPNGAPTAFPTYDYFVNAGGGQLAANLPGVQSDGLNEADEMDLYSPNPILDSHFGPTDIEWLYRQQDVDGASLSSRLQQLAPVSLTNGLDGARRRRLFSLDFWDLNNFAWTNDNPSGAFPTNSRFVVNANAGYTTLNLPTPALAHRDKKINLNYPLPVSNDPNEPIRQKWINDAYQLLKSILPPKAVDTPEELAQLSQYVINIIDFRDPDATMTHWVNPDVVIAYIPNVPAATPPLPTTPVPATSVVLAMAGTNPQIPAAFASTPLVTTTTIALDQYGMEYSPVAINEVLAYSYLYLGTGAARTRANRFFIELVNTQTSPELASSSVLNPALNLGGTLPETAPVGGIFDPYSSGSWDIVFTADDPYSRPDPYRGQLLPFAKTYGLTPLNADAFTPTTGASGISLTPLGQNSSIPAPTIAVLPLPATDYFCAFGSTTGGNDLNAPSPTNMWTAINAPPTTGANQASATTYSTQGYTPPTLLQQLTLALDPINPSNTAVPATSPIQLYPGVLPTWAGPTPSTTAPNPQTTTVPTNYQTLIPGLNPPGTPPTTVASTTPNQTPVYYWVCLRRPANPLAPVSAANPMIVVDSVRFPYMDGTPTLASTSTDGQAVPTTRNNYPTLNNIYSVQRFQPYRGGHAVPLAPPTTWAAGAGVTPTTGIPVDPRYGYTEQIVVPTANSQLESTSAKFYTDPGAAGGTFYATPKIYHTMGWANEYEQGSSNSLADPWEYFPFNDRDFTSVAELMLVPGCSPGLFTKQFVEFAPSQTNNWNIFGAVIPQGLPGYSPPPTGGPITTITGPLLGGTTASTATPPGGATGTPTGPGYPGTKLNTIQAYNTGSTPFQYVTNGGAAPTGSVQPRTFPYLNDEFFYTAFGAAATIDPGGQVGGYAGDGWFKMFEFFEVPSQSISAIGPVAAGSNFDWLRQDIKPGQLNLNLIMDEEVLFSVLGKQSITQTNGQMTATTPNYTMAPDLQNPSDQFSQQLLNFTQIGGLPNGNYIAGQSGTGLYMLVAGASPVPLVVTSTLLNGAPATAHPISSQGMAALDPVSNSFFTINSGLATPTYTPPIYGNAIKTAWVQFLNMRHGGSGFIFGFGTGSVGQNSAAIPFTPPQNPPAVNSLLGTGIPAERPFHSLSYPDIDYTVMRPAALPPSLYTNPAANSAATDFVDAPPASYTTAAPYYYAGDPGIRNPTLYVGYPTENYPGTLASGVGVLSTPWATTYDPVYPSAIPPRRFFQVPDAYTGGVAISMTPASTINSGPSNAGETSDPYLNNLSPVPNTAMTTNLPYIAPGAVAAATYPNAVNTAGTAYVANANLTDGTVNLYWTGASAASLYDGTFGDPAQTVSSPTNPYLGSGTSDNRQHPYWRSEQLQRVINLTTPRTHQFAVWVTVGFFEVKRLGDQGMFVYNPTLAFDIMGPEIGAANGKSVRFRSFFLVDRLRLTGFNPSSSTGFRQAIVYQTRIQ